MMATNEYLKQETVHRLAEAVQRGGRSLDSVPGLLAKLIDQQLWLDRIIDGEHTIYEPTEFKRFVEADYPAGLNTTIETLQALSHHEPQVMAFLAHAKVGKPGGQIGNTNQSAKRVNARGRMVESDEATKRNNITLRKPSDKSRGTTSDQAYLRLRSAGYEIDPETREPIAIKDVAIADLYQQVMDKKLSPHAAMVKAGFRKRKIAVALDDPQSAVDTIRKHMTPENLARLIQLLAEQT